MNFLLISKNLSLNFHFTSRAGRHIRPHRRRLQEKGAQLLPFQSGAQSLRDLLKVGHEGVWLGDGIVLTKGGKIDVLAGQESADVAEIGREGIVTGQRDDEGAVGAQMRLGGHADGGIGDAVGDLGEGIPGTGADEQSLQRDAGAQRLGIGNGAHDLSAANILDLPDKIRGFPETVKIAFRDGLPLIRLPLQVF